MEDTLLEVRDLQVEFSTKMGIVRVLDKVNLKVDPRQTVGIIGESGCGKSMMALSIMGLVPIPPGRIAGGEILYRGTDLLTLEKDAILDIRGKRIAMIFQEPMVSLDPLFPIGDQLGEVVRLHKKVSQAQANERSSEMLRTVGIPSPETRLKQYPFELSGGMRQRVMIAIALLCDPELLIADEPTTALDVTIQAQILDLLRSINEKLGTSIILITHDLGVVASMVDTVAVMYCGHIVEKADVRTIFQHPLHPYTEGLLRSIPHMDDSQGDLATIEGSVPSIYHMPEGCAFHTRCACCRKICTQKQPPLLTLDGEHTVQCWKYTPQWDEEGGSDHV